MTRMSAYAYDPPAPEATAALVRYSYAAAAHAMDPSSPPPDPALLLIGLPQGPLGAARMVREEEEGQPTIAFNIKARNERFIEPEGFMIVRVLALSGTGVHIDTNERGSDGYHYIEIGHETGLTLFRILTDAQKGETVRQRQDRDHHDLTSLNLIVEPGPARSYRGRREAMADALAAFDRNASGWGLDRLLSRRDYQVLIRNAFRLYDLKFAGRFLRPIAEPCSVANALKVASPA